ncbi:MAG: hypothetical protein ACI9R3_004777 [Verrucomicrobiales bacterium]|jgi:hypothetical protein
MPTKKQDEDPRIGEFLSQCTEGLNVDPELRLQTQRELRSHLESRMAEEADDEDQVGAALEAMGSVIEIAGPLQTENARRMKARALVRLGVRAVLIPATLFVSLWLLWDAVLKVSVVLAMTDTKPLHPLVRPLPGLRAEEKLILYGDKDIVDPVERTRALWKHFPDDPVYLAQYLATAATSSSANSPEFNEALTIAEKLDPDNAFYHFLAANVAAKKAFGNVEHDENGTRFDIVDKGAAEIFHTETLTAAKSKRCNSYRNELACRRLAILGKYPTQSVGLLREQYAAVVGASQTNVVPLSLFRFTLGFIQTLRGYGKNEEATALADAFTALCAHQFADKGNTLSDWVLVMALADLVSQYLPDASGDLPVSALTKRKIEEARLFSTAFHAHLDSEPDIPFLSEIKIKGGLLGAGVADLSSILIWDSDISFDLTPGRWLEYILLERLSLVVFLSLLIVTSAWCFVRFLWIRWRGISDPQGHSSIPLLLVPRAKEIALVIAVGVVVPLAVYFLYSRWTAISGRDFNVSTQIYRFATEQIILWITMLGTVGMLTRRLVRKRFRQLGISEREERALYRATLMRSAAPLLAAVALTCALIAHPYLDAQESRLLKADTMMQVDPDGGFSRFESKMVEAIRNTMLKAKDQK